MALVVWMAFVGRFKSYHALGLCCWTGWIILRLVMPLVHGLPLCVTLRTAPVFLLSAFSVPVQLTRTPLRGHRPTTQRKGTHLGNDVSGVS